MAILRLNMNTKACFISKAQLYRLKTAFCEQHIEGIQGVKHLFLSIWTNGCVIVFSERKVRKQACFPSHSDSYSYCYQLPKVTQECKSCTGKCCFPCFFSQLFSITLSVCLLVFGFVCYRDIFLQEKGEKHCTDKQ